tara:strand:+ start:1221 stop:1745 length:525 start_codon:yes stop_codon:yes gene_type:complete
MHLSALEEYGIRCALSLARESVSGSVPASRIAEREGLSNEYVSKIMFLFRKAGIVKAERGNQGGFSFLLPSEEISLKMIFEALSPIKEKDAGFCEKYAGKGDVCVHSNECSIRPVWSLVSRYFDEILSTLTLKDLMVKEQESYQRVKTVALSKMDEIFNQFKTKNTNANEVSPL